jgi:hypothetical protein
MFSYLYFLATETGKSNVTSLANTGFIVAAAVTVSSLIILVALIVRIARKGKTKPKEPPESGTS